MSGGSSCEPSRERVAERDEPLVTREKPSVVLHHAFPETLSHFEIGDAGDGEAKRADAPLVRQRRELGGRRAPLASVTSKHRSNERLIEVRAVAPCERGHHQIVR